MRLNLGCGPDIQDNFVNLDIREIEGALRRDVSDRESMKPFAGADEILAYDVLEHFPREKAREALAMWVELLKPGGVLRIRCPDIRHAASESLKRRSVTADQDEWFELLLYGGQDYPENYHKCGFTMATLSRLLQEMGCLVIRRETTNAGNVEIDARKA